jgi:hypothetical protein
VSDVAVARARSAVSMADTFELAACDVSRPYW